VDRTLEQAVLDAVVGLWPSAGGSLSSRLVYQHLREEGIDLPNGAMMAVWHSLMEQRLVNGVLISTPNSMETHGGLTVTWVSPELLDQAR
jgi:hypothetical protein